MVNLCNFRINDSHDKKTYSVKFDNTFVDLIIKKTQIKKYTNKKVHLFPSRTLSGFVSLTVNLLAKYEIE
jgi:hypothetical protein